MPRVNNDTQANTQDSTLELAKKRYKESRDYQQQNWWDKWDRDNRLYDNERVYASYIGTVDTFVPMVFSTVETMVAAFNNSSVRFQYKSSNPLFKQSSSTIKAANGLVDEWWDDDQWDLLVEEGSRETFITGMAGHMVSWESDHPHIEQYAMRDMVIDPTVKKPADLQKRGHYCGRRFFVRKGQLDDYEVLDTDPKSKTYLEMVKRFKPVKETTAKGNQGDPDDKELKEMFTGSTLDNARNEQDEVIEIWTVDEVVTIKNREDVIENTTNPYKLRHQQMLEQKYVEDAVNNGDEMVDEGQRIAAAKTRAKSEAKGIVPFFFLRNYRRTSLFYAKSEIDSIAKEQELLNDFTNMEGDFIIRQLAPQRELDPKYKDFIDLINNDPDTVYPFTPGSLANIQSPQLPANSFNNRLNLKNEIRETTAIDQVTKGVQSSSDATATEIKAQLNQSGQRIQSKARIFEKDGFYWWGWILMKMMQMYITEPMVVEINGNSGISAEEALQKYGIELPKGCAVFDPDEFSQVTNVSVQLDVDAQGKQEQTRKNYLEAFTMLIQDPSNNLEEIKRRILPKALPELDQDDLDAILTPSPQQQMQQPMMPGEEQGQLTMPQMPQEPQPELQGAVSE